MHKKETLRPIKRLGQNFLIDKRYIKRIIDSCVVTPDDRILEIGPGRGALTEGLALLCGHITAVEIDKKLCDVLKDKFSNSKSIDIVCADILKYDIKAESQKNSAVFKVIGNLPYYITSPVIIYLTENKKYINTAFLTVQKEVAERLVSPPGKKSYGSLSCLVQYHCNVKILLNMSKKVFYPQPQIESSLVSMEFLKEPKVRVKNEALFFKVIRAAFNKRRKTLLNAISGAPFPDKVIMARILAGLGINPERRGETLNLEEFASIADNLEESIGK
ncbi:MAG: ribosomal RNA small subunit methyltransferase A [Candidatus Omnitrophica bacterium]|nr:ribosomal RNA small subunit methyltransferase A [Candidatus Omnitrophota bacterium]